VPHRTTDALGNEAEAADFGRQTPTRRARDAMASEFAVTVTPARYVLLHLANVLTGYSVKAMQNKIACSVWQQDKVWKRAPDGRILIDMVGFHKWVEGR
jgi:hypothetical protein